VDRTQVGILEKANEVCLGHLLETKEGGGLETKIDSHLTGDLADEALEGEFPEKKVGGLLVLADLANRDGTRAEPAGFLDPAHGKGLFAGSLDGELLTGGLSSRGFACGLFGTSLCVCVRVCV
jgi:hypothetical protein